MTSHPLPDIDGHIPTLLREVQEQVVEEMRRRQEVSVREVMKALIGR